MKQKIRELIDDLRRCAKQNEKDSQMHTIWYDHYEAYAAKAVAAEQWRMIKILRRLI